MEYFIDLTQHNKKSKLQLYLGIVGVLLIIAYIILLATKETISIYDWINPVWISLFTVNALMQGTGRSIENLFGEAFVQINKDVIAIKPGIYESEAKVFWNDISEINYSTNKFNITLRNNSHVPVYLGMLEYEIVQQIKKSISETGKSKDIPVLLG